MSPPQLAGTSVVVERDQFEIVRAAKAAMTASGLLIVKTTAAEVAGYVANAHAFIGFVITKDADPPGFEPDGTETGHTSFPHFLLIFAAAGEGAADVEARLRANFKLSRL